MSKALIIILIIAVLAGGTVGVLFATGVIGGDKGGDDTTVTCTDGHTWKVESKTDAKCYVEGSQVLVCEVCSETMTQVLPKTEHKLATIAAKAATCTEKGNTAGSRCITPGCGYVEGNEPINMTGHIEVDTPAKAATCTSMGYSEGGKHCATCFAILKEPDETYPMIGHNYVDAGYIAPTCAAEGSLGGTRCDACGKIGQEPTETYDKLEEHSAELEIISYATCTTDGYKQCPVCLAQEVWEYKSADLHKFDTVAEDAVAASCTEQTNGKTTVYKCSNPGCEAKVGGVEISWESLHGENLEWTITIEATTTSAGEKVAHCDVCGKDFREDIPVITDGDFNDDNNIYDDDIIGGKKEEDDAA
ncbi:MAG: hypothetical protein IJW03_00440 [Clostridia bacterium]|nr:hypothetical protein [Clostridia bacterium]